MAHHHEAISSLGDVTAGAEIKIHRCQVATCHRQKPRQLPKKTLLQTVEKGHKKWWQPGQQMVLCLMRTGPGGSNE